MQPESNDSQALMPAEYEAFVAEPPMNSPAEFMPSQELNGHEGNATDAVSRTSAVDEAANKGPSEPRSDVVMSIDADLDEKRGDEQINSFDTATLDVASGHQHELDEPPEAAKSGQLISDKSSMDSLPTPAERTIVVLPVSCLEGDARVRDLTDYGAIEYAQEMADGAKFPPPEVRWRRDPDGRVHYTLVDGFHRLAAHAIRKKTTIECFLSPGDLRDAKWAAVGSNVTHGIRRSDADKRLAVWIVLEDDEWRLLADRVIARQIGMSPSTVGAIRRHYNHKHGIANEEATVRKGKDGRVLSYASRALQAPSRDDVSAVSLGADTRAAPAAHVEECAGAVVVVVSAPPESRKKGSGNGSPPTREPLAELARDAAGQRAASGPTTATTTTQAVTPERPTDGGDAVAPLQGAQEVNAGNDGQEADRLVNGSCFTIRYADRHGVEHETRYDIDRPEGGLPYEITSLASLVVHVRKLRAAQVPEATLVAVFERLMKA